MPIKECHKKDSLVYFCFKFIRKRARRELWMLWSVAHNICILIFRVQYNSRQKLTHNSFSYTEGWVGLAMNLSHFFFSRFFYFLLRFIDARCQDPRGYKDGDIVKIWIRAEMKSGSYSTFSLWTSFFSPFFQRYLHTRAGGGE